MIFRKWGGGGGGGGIKGRLELFQKFITFGDAILPLTLRLCAQLFGRLSWWYESPLATRSKSLSNSIKQHDIQNSNTQEVKTTFPFSASCWCFRSLWKSCCGLFGLNWKVKQSDQLYFSNLNIYNIFSPLIPHSIHLQIHQITLLKMALAGPKY